jgi:hypothetical protein
MALQSLLLSRGKSVYQCWREMAASPTERSWCVLEFARCISCVVVQRAFRRQFGRRGHYMKLKTFLFYMVVTSCISVQYLWKYGFAKSYDNLYALCIKPLQQRGREECPKMHRHDLILIKIPLVLKMPRDWAWSGMLWRRKVRRGIWNVYLIRNVKRLKGAHKQYLYKLALPRHAMKARNWQHEAWLVTCGVKWPLSSTAELKEDHCTWLDC